MEQIESTWIIEFSFGPGQLKKESETLERVQWGANMVLTGLESLAHV